LLLAAGLGTRLRPITDHFPKCLVPIHGKPLLSYWLELLVGHGVDRVLVNTHYLPDAVGAFLATAPERAHVDVVHEARLLGTGGTVLRNREFLAGGAFMVAHADNLTRFDVESFISSHRQRPPHVDITMMTFETDMPQTCGIVEQDDRGIVVAFHEKKARPPGNRANAAVYIFEPSVVECLASLNREVIDISLDLIPRYLGRMHCFHNADYHRDIGNPESLRRAELEYRPR
jgi:mannose-1-phosphate guanylyltransferase